MAWQDDATYILVQNYTAGVSAISGTPEPVGGWERINVTNYYPMRPARFPSTSDLQIAFSLGGSRSCDCLALIDVHTGNYTGVANDVDAEAAFQVKLANDSGTVFDWVSLSTTQLAQWGRNFFAKFTLEASTNWTVHVRGTPTTTMADSSIGCILLGRHYQFPGNPTVGYGRTVNAAVSSIGGRFGGHQFFGHNQSKRTIQLGSFHRDEDSRAELERLVAGRGPLRSSTMHGWNQYTRKRADIPIAYIGPDMWATTGSDHGSCMFGLVGGFNSSSIVGGRAVSNVTIEEVV